MSVEENTVSNHRQDEHFDSNSQVTFTELIDGVRSQSPDAQTEFIRRFKRNVLRQVRRRLNPKMRRLFDSEDFCQAVWQSFFTKDVNGSFATEKEMARFLDRVSMGKVIDEVRKRLMTEGYDIGLDQEYREGNFSDSGGAFETTPSQIISAKEQKERFLQDASERDRKIFELKAAGERIVDIAAQLGVNPKTVKRVIDRYHAKVE